MPPGAIFESVRSTMTERAIRMMIGIGAPSRKNKIERIGNHEAHRPHQKSAGGITKIYFIGMNCRPLCS